MSSSEENPIVILPPPLRFFFYLDVVAEDAGAALHQPGIVVRQFIVRQHLAFRFAFGELFGELFGLAYREPFAHVPFSGPEYVPVRAWRR